MSDLNTVLTRMMNEPEFANAVFADADKALAEYNLLADEITQFKNLSRTDFEAFASASPEERKSMSLTNVEFTLTVTDTESNTIRGSGFYQIRDEGG